MYRKLLIFFWAWWQGRINPLIAQGKMKIEAQQGIISAPHNVPVSKPSGYLPFWWNTVQMDYLPCLLKHSPQIVALWPSESPEPLQVKTLWAGWFLKVILNYCRLMKRYTIVTKAQKPDSSGDFRGKDPRGKLTDLGPFIPGNKSWPRQIEAYWDLVA